MDYVVPGKKSHRILEGPGSSGIIVKKVILPALEAERTSAMPHIRSLTEINRDNDTFHFLEYDAPAKAYVFSAVLHKPSRLLFRGRIWVGAGTYGLHRVKGTPAVSPSWWVRRTEFTHEYSRVNGFWLPTRHLSHADLRIFGRSTLEIDYGTYRFPETTEPAAGAR